MDGFTAAAALLPPALRRAAESLPPEDRARCEELRLRRGREATALVDGKEYGLGTGPVREDDLRAVAEAATRCSFHAAGEQLKRGFLSAPGGVRVGLCGEAVTGPAGLEGLRELSGMAIRVPRAVEGCADGIWAALTAGGFVSTVICAPPGGGKTTLLRELVRRLSWEGLRVAVADERGEIAGARNGEPGFDLGPRTDVMTGLGKAQAVGMLVRTMDPQVVAMDEIGGPEDAQALRRAAGCGVALLATAHGERGCRDGQTVRELIGAEVFRRRVWVERRDGRRRYTVERALCG